MEAETPGTVNGARWGTGTLSTSDASSGQMICIMGRPAGQPKRIEAIIDMSPFLQDFTRRRPRLKFSEDAGGPP